MKNRKKLITIFIGIITIAMLFWVDLRLNATSQVQDYNELFPIRVLGQYGYIDHLGRIAIAPQYDAAGDFAEGLACVKQNKKVGFINSYGEVIITEQYDQAETFHGGLAIVELNKKKGVINTSGEYVVQPMYDYIHPFVEEKAIIVLGSHDHPHYGVVNNKGQILATPSYRSIADYSEGRAAFYNNAKYGFLDDQGQVVIQAEFDSVKPFHEGVAAVKQGMVWGFIDYNGRWIIHPKYDNIGDLSQGLAVVKIGEKYGCIDEHGRWIIQPVYEQLLGFKECRAAAKKEGKWGFIDRKAHFVIPPMFDMVTDFDHGRAIVRFARRQAVIDQTGDFIIKPDEYNQIRRYGNYFRIEYTDGDIGFVDLDGKTICRVKPKDDSMELIHGLIRTSGTEYAYYDLNNNIIWQEPRNIIGKHDVCLNGEWSVDYGQSGMLLRLYVGEGSITGSHYAWSQGGRRIDSSGRKLSIVGTLNKDWPIKVNWISSYSNIKGTAEIIALEDDVILWRIVSCEKGELYFPYEAVLHRKSMD